MSAATPKFERQPNQSYDADGNPDAFETLNALVPGVLEVGCSVDQRRIIERHSKAQCSAYLQLLTAPAIVSQTWAPDFMKETLSEGRCVR